MRRIIALSAVLALAACGSSPPQGETQAEVAGDAEAGIAAGGDAGGAEITTAEPASRESAPAANADAPAQAPTSSATPTPSSTSTPAPTPTNVAMTGPPPAFASCGMCHSVNAGENRVGPSLAGVVGRRAGSVASANYSAAMQEANLALTEVNLDRYLADPAAVVPGTSMPNPRLDAAQRRAVIAYLKTL